MTYLPDFPLTRSGKLSTLLMNQGIDCFHRAIAYLKKLPYRRLENPRDLTAVVTYHGGTFTARHALLVQLAREQGMTDMVLTLCVYEFNQEDCPMVGQVLKRHGIVALPEMCGCIKYRQRLFTIAASDLCLQREVVSEVEIAPVQIGNFKKRYHQNYLENWLQLEKLSQQWSVEQLWRIREECLHAIERHWNHCRQPLAA